MQKIHNLLCIAVVMLQACLCMHGQEPSLFMGNQDFLARRQLAAREPWAKQSLAELLKEADDFPHAYETKFGLADAAPPPKGGQWLHWYACPETGHPLQFRPPDQNICPDDGKNFSGYPYDQVVYQMRNDALAEAAVALGLAFRFSGNIAYAQKAVAILTAYTQIYPTYELHDINGKAGPNGGKAYAQTLDESLWLIKIAWTYDLVRGSGLLTSQQRHDFEEKVLRASAAVVMKAHKEPTYNIQSWINGAIGAVGFTLNDQSLIQEAIDGSIGFRHQMHTFVTEGFWAEGAWGYQFYAMRPLTMLAQMATRRGIDLWKQEPNLITLFHSPLGVVLPDGSLPAFNDSGSPDLYDEAYLYEVAYASTIDPALLTVIAHGSRSSREAFLFGKEKLPNAPPPKLTSAVFPEAGYAALRSTRNDLTVIMKFGPHGGAHGHYDKLNFILFSHGRTLAIDPGAFPYGLPLHREWDSKTIAHNTISVDGDRQAAATGKLLDWKVGDDWVAVRADAGDAYSTARLERTILLTANYVLVMDQCRSTDGKPHTYDWAYHNAGSDSLSQTPGMTPYSFPAGNGYERLSHGMGFKTDSAVVDRFLVDAHPAPATEISNSTPASYRSDRSDIRATSIPLKSVELDLQMVPEHGTEVITGYGPARTVDAPVPFVVVRRSGKDVAFTTVLAPHDPGKTNTREQTTIRQASSNTYLIKGDGFSDRISTGNQIELQHGAQ